MGKPEFGAKHVCEGCSERFYDLNRSPAICFKCGAVQSPPKVKVYRPTRMASERGAFARRAAPAPVEEKADDAGELAVEDIEEAEIADDDDSEVEIPDADDDDDETAGVFKPE